MHADDNPDSGQPLAITWLGHATVLIELDGLRLLTDPVVRDRVGPLVRIAPKLDPAAYGRIDCVLLSHLHADHTHLASLRTIGRETPILVPRPAARWLRRSGLENAQDIAVGEAVALRGLSVTATPAVHPRRRTPLGPAADPVGYLISGSSSTYFAGDTDLFAGMADLRGLLTVALLPVAGWGKRLGPGHLDAHRAAQAAALLAPRVAIPIHWGTLALPPPARPSADPAAPARTFAALVSRQSPAVAVRVLAPGERTLF